MEAQTQSPMMERGRKEARELMNTSARIVRTAGKTETADAATALSTSLQLCLTTALVDGFDAQEVYSALAGALAWSVKRLDPEDRIGVLTAIVGGVVEVVRDVPKTEALN